MGAPRPPARPGAAPPRAARAGHGAGHGAVAAGALRLTLAADPLCVRAALGRVDRRLQALGIDPETRATAELVLAEALNNAVAHAHAGERGEIALRVAPAGDALLCELRDRGAPFASARPGRDRPQEGPAPAGAAAAVPPFGPTRPAPAPAPGVRPAARFLCRPTCRSMWSSCPRAASAAF